MGLEEIKEKVLGEAKGKAEAGLRAARQEAEEMRARGEQAAKSRRPSKMYFGPRWSHSPPRRTMCAPD
jgi:hypothetical protein